jgi:hypothetical protein
VTARAELADEKAQHELTKQLLSNLFSSPNLRIRELQNQVQSFEIKLAVVTNQLAIADKNQSRSNLHLALTQQLLSASQKIAKDADSLLRRKQIDTDASAARKFFASKR